MNIYSQKSMGKIYNTRTSLSDIYLEQLKTNNEKKKSWTFPHNCSHVEPQANNAALYKIHVASIINQD